MPLSASKLLSLSMSAARRRAWLLVPLVVAETLAFLFSLLPTAVLLGRAWIRADGESALLGLGLLGALTEPRTWLTAVYAWLFVTVVAWLVRTGLQAGGLGTLAQAIAQPGPEDDAAFTRTLLHRPERWIAAGFVTSLLRGVVLVSALGGVLAGMSYFVAQPGALAALVMTLACAMVLAGPLLAVALELAFARAVLLGEGPLDAVARALGHAWRRRNALLPAWFGLVLVALGLAFVSATGAALLQGPAEPQIQVLFLGPRAAWSIAVMAVMAAVALVRLGLYAALVQEERGVLVVPPRRRPPPRRVPWPALVLDAVPVLPPGDRV